MNVELHALRRARTLSARSCVTLGLTLSRPAFIGLDVSGLAVRVLAIRVLASVCVAALMLSAPAALAQDAPAPPKVKTAKPKAAAAKPKEASEDDAGDLKSAAAPVKRDPAQAQRTFENGMKLLQASKAEPAIQSFSSIISGGQVPPQLMARALHQRGVAYRAVGKPALAVSDLTSALWLKGGLSDAERADATQQRTSAYREAGLPDQSDSADGKATPAARRIASAPQSVGATTTGPTQPVTTASLAPEQARAAAPPASPIGSFFNNLFGSGASSTPGATAPAPVNPTGPQQPSTSGWSSATTPNPPAAPKTARAAAMVTPPPQAEAQAPATPAKAVGTGGVHARIITRSEAEANTLASRLKSEFGGPLEGRAPTVSQAQFGGMGSFFQVRVGPYKSPVEAQQFCTRIKSTGADCVAVTQ